MDNLISIKQIATKLDMSVSTLHYWCEFGLIKPAQKFGLFYLFEEKDTIKKIKFIKAQQDKNRKKLVDIKKLLKEQE